MNRTLRKAAVGTAAAVALFAATTAPAMAANARASGATPKTLTDIQTAGAKATSARVTSLNAAIAKVMANTYLTSPDRATILSTLHGDLTAMGTVGAAIAADTTRAQAATDYKSIFATYRVYAVALPQAHLAAAADALQGTALPKLTAAQVKLTASLAGPNASKSTPALQADLADMTTQIAAAQGSLNGLASTALAVTPAAYDANHTILAPVRQSLITATTAAKRARTDAKTILAALK